MDCIAVVLAGGRGARMMIENNKVLAKVCNKPLICYLLDELQKLNLKDIFVVLGNGADEVKKVLPKRVKTVYQSQQLGTGDALKTAAIGLKKYNGKILLLNGDGPIVKSDTLAQIMELDDAKMKIFAGFLDKNSRFGRIKRTNGTVERIIEAKDCTQKELKIKEQNLGIYCFDNQTLQKFIYDLQCNNAQNEYYVTDLVEKFFKNGHKVDVFLQNERDFYLPSVNTLAELIKLERKMQKIINKRLIEEGVRIVDPSNTYVDIFTSIQKYSTIYPNCHIKNSVLGQKVTILPNCVIENCVIDDGVVVAPNSVLFGQNLQNK